MKKNTDIQKLILRIISKKKQVRVADIVKETGFSRAYVNRFFKKLKDEEKIALVGKANLACYIVMGKSEIEKAKQRVFNIQRTLKNKKLSEDVVLDEIKKNTGIFLHLPKNISDILDYSFTKMLNNAIEHSKSKIIKISIKRDDFNVALQFKVIDQGIGIFNNIMQKKRLKNELEAIQDLLKGKQTTAPKKHTGEGIFFTSKIADMLTIQSSRKKLIFNNLLDDIFIKNTDKKIIGTKVTFSIFLKSRTSLNNVFKEYSGNMFEFSKTKVNVRLYKMDNSFISRSQARRILVGLDKFKTVILDFKNVDTVGQAFTDEIFRVWQNHYPRIKIMYKNANENIIFMIKRSLTKN